VERRRRIEAYGLCRDRGTVALVARRFSLPGTVVSHGEPPTTTVQRAFADLGVSVVVGQILRVITDLDEEPGLVTHHDRLIFAVRSVGTATEHEGLVRVGAEELAGLTLPRFTAVALGLTPPVLSGAPPPAPRPPRTRRCGRRRATSVSRPTAWSRIRPAGCC
jgi:ADP-ribose pyrophosphatase YjhB (NUDIX family)